MDPRKSSEVLGGSRSSQEVRLESGICMSFSFFDFAALVPWICGVLLLADEHIAWTCTVGDEMSSYTHTHTLMHAHVRTHTHIGVTETKPNCPTALRGGQLLKNDIGTLFVYCKLRILSNCPARGAAGQLGLVCTKCCSQSLCVTQSVSLR